MTMKRLRSLSFGLWACVWWPLFLAVEVLRIAIGAISAILAMGAPKAQLRASLRAKHPLLK